jgi:hypothetical protein
MFKKKFHEFDRVVYINPGHPEHNRTFIHTGCGFIDTNLCDVIGHDGRYALEYDKLHVLGSIHEHKNKDTNVKS